MAEKEYIERGAAISTACKGCNKEFPNEPCEPAECYIQQGLFAIPTADVVEVRHGEWVLNEPVYICSVCGEVPDYFLNGWDWEIYEYPNYCPNCGAKMDGKGEG